MNFRDKNELSDEQLIKQMTLNIDNLYEKYKENASLDRTMIKLKFKDKKISKE